MTHVGSERHRKKKLKLRLPLHHRGRVTGKPIEDIRSFFLYSMKVNIVNFIAGILEMGSLCSSLRTCLTCTELRQYGSRRV